MAFIKKFSIDNFKGIEHTDLSLDGRVQKPIVTLVGLNESGKTTLLEALSHFVTGDPITSKVFDATGASSEALSLIPIHRKANFTGKIKISAEIELDNENISTIANMARDEFKLDVEEDLLTKPFSIFKQYEFKDGNLVPKGTGTRWTIQLNVKSTKAKFFRKYTPPDEGPSLSSNVWKLVLQWLPSISYFPTFLVEMPSRIYLSEHNGETPTNRHYRSVLQDVLDSLGEDLDLETHVAQRIKDFREQEENPNWISIFWGTPGKAQINSVIQKISNAISKEIIGSWKNVFHRPISAKGITLEWNIDTEKENLPYAQILISDGESSYALHERSLGFRWFFSFLLFTRFKQSKNRKTIFLFDEPAANLHFRAQSELLESFQRIIEGGHAVIYSTHSHYMINPLWLAGAYIIENKAIDYDSDEAIGGLTSRPTEITAQAYNSFVSQYPERVSYYQPVLERLGYINPKIMPEKPVVITEGVSDFYAFSVICRKELKRAKFEFFPGLGAGASGPLISFLLSAGKRFIILLDDDLQGKKEVPTYQKKWFLRDDQVFTLANLDKSFAGKKLETILSARGKLAFIFLKRIFTNPENLTVVTKLEKLSV